MSTANQNSSGYKAFQATGVAIGVGKRVFVDASNPPLIAVAGANVIAIGVTVENIAANGYGTVKLFNAPGTFIMCANAAITAGAQVFPTASGNIDDAGTTALPLVALEAATAQGDLIEVAPALLGA